MDGPSSAVASTGSISLDFAAAANPGDWSTLSFSETLQAASYFVPPASGFADWRSGAASATNNFSSMFVTAGPERTGYIEVQGFATTSRETELSYNLDFGITGLANSTGLLTLVHCPSEQGPLTCSNGYWPLGYFRFFTPAPVMLGTPFTLEAIGNMNASTNYFDSQFTYGSLTFQYQFRFFEADGVTPVRVAEMPEPATWVLFATSICGLGILHLRRSK